jgi:hypothetical protein
MKGVIRVGLKRSFITKIYEQSGVIRRLVTNGPHVKII